jgi:hypothetical protein
MTKSANRPGTYTRQNYSVITSARIATSEEMAGRVKRYAITMAFRTACFIAMIWTPGVWRWILFACAVFLPYVAVLFANQAHQRGATGPLAQAAPSDAKQLTTGPEESEIISGELDEPQTANDPSSDPSANARAS